MFSKFRFFRFIIVCTKNRPKFYWQIYCEAKYKQGLNILMKKTEKTIMFDRRGGYDNYYDFILVITCY